VPTSAARGAAALGSMSVGHPHAGFLFNAVKMPESPFWALSDPAHAWGTEETVHDLQRCIRSVHEQFPGSAPVVIGAISAERGGALPPHKSHRTGRDADVYFFRQGEHVKIFEAATASDLDRERTWALLKAFVTLADVEFVLIDQKVQDMLEAHALSVGEDVRWVSELFHGRDKYELPMVKHVPGHVAHMHVRFVSRVARERGRLAYDTLVEQGHIDVPTRGIEHRVARGDTLSGIARKYGTTVEDLSTKNRLSSTRIRVGQVLEIREHIDVRGARDAVQVPWRPMVPPRSVPIERDVHAAAFPRIDATGGAPGATDSRP
jgi:penicillin-insensitive murein endopeptidase